MDEKKYGSVFFLDDNSLFLNSALDATKNSAFRFSVFSYKILVPLYSTERFVII
jgi:hypothetical protein